MPVIDEGIVPELEAKIKRLRVALIFYADKENWRAVKRAPGTITGVRFCYEAPQNMSLGIALDNGEKARAALSEKCGTAPPVDEFNDLEQASEKGASGND